MNTSSTEQQCLRCRAPFAPTAEVVVCSACGEAQHRACWEANGRCATDGCAGVPTTAAIFTPPVAPPPPVVSPYPASVPPPPLIHPQQGMVAQIEHMWLEGENTLVVPSGCALPPICLATGETDDLIPRKRTEAWAPLWIWAFIVLGLLIVYIVQLIIQKTGKIEFFVTRAYTRQNSLIIAGNWALFLLLFSGALTLFSLDTLVPLGVVMLFASIFAPLILAVVLLQPYTVMKIDATHLWLKFRKPGMAAMIYEAYAQGRR
jgi:hypothetical protein